VAGVNFTFEDARRSDASASEIQSDGGFGICQSGSLDADASELALDGGGVPSVELDLGSFPSARAALPFGCVRAQPVPLKCTAGAEMEFLMGPWQFGHTMGPLA
jgi:hypothetical protein